MAASSNIWLSYNRAIDAWAHQTWQLQSQLLQAAVKNGTDHLVSSLRYRTKMQAGMITYAGFTFDRTGIYLEKGVGGVYKIDPKGSGVVKRSTPGDIMRHPHPWLEPSLDQNLQLLNVVVANEFSKVVGNVSETLESVVKVKGLK